MRLILLTLLIIALGSVINISANNTSSYLKDSIDNHFAKTYNPNRLGLSHEKVISNKIFYDSLKQKAERNKFTKILHKLVIRKAKQKKDTIQNRKGYFMAYEGKMIGSITFKQLAPFGGNFDDHDLPAKTWASRQANKVHTTTKPHVLRKALLFKCGDKVNPIMLQENERLIREFPFIKDVRILIESRLGDDKIVDITVISKDVFSYSGSVHLKGFPNGDFKIVNSNTWGQGHEAWFKIVSRSDESPQTGFDARYSIFNVHGTFVNAYLGLLQNYEYKGYGVILDKQFLSPQIKQAGGVVAYRMDRTKHRYFMDPVEATDYLGYDFFEAWYGHKIDLKKSTSKHTPAIILSGRFKYQDYWQRPTAGDQEQLYANTTNLNVGITYTRWYHKQTNLVYGFGSTEDIPAGFRAEFVGGYDDNEFVDQWYTQFSLSGGRFISDRNDFLYGSLAFGGYFNKRHFQQGIIQAKSQYISRLFNLWHFRSRQFFNLNYTAGLKRFDNEQLYLNGKNGLRSFSDSISGTQRLTFNSETVLFHNRNIYGFRTASFHYLDLGIIGPSNWNLKQQKIFLGLGLGIRTRNESLIFRTIQVRFSYFPVRPEGMTTFKIKIKGRLKPLFNSFGGRKPEPIRFE